MSGRPPTIGVLFASAADRRLLRDFLQEEGYLVFSPEIQEHAVADLAGVDLILVEGKVAQRLRDALINLKSRVGAAFSFLPVLVAQPFPDPVGPWLAAGFDDVVSLPIVKPLLSVRIKTWLRIREEAVGRFRALVEESPIGFYRTTPDGRVLYANPALVRLLGFSSFAELAQHNLEELAQRVGYPRGRFKELLEREGRVVGFESVWIRSDGQRFWTRENARVVRDEFGRILYYEGTVEDVSEVRRLAERLNAVGELGRKLVLSRSLAEVAQAVVEGACALVGFTDVSLFLVDEKHEELVLLAHSLGEPHGPRRLPLDAERGIVVQAARTGKVQSIPDVSQEPAYIRTYPQNRSELAIPLKVGARVIGVLNVESERLAAFGPEEERVLTTLADMAAVALENARLFQEIEDLRQFHETIVQTLAEGVALVDVEGRIIFANPTAARLVGYEASEVIGKHWREFVAPPFWEFVEEQRQRRAQGEEGTYEVVLVRKDGSTFPAVVHARPFYKDAKFLGSLVAFADISLLKEFEARYRHFAEQTEEGFYRLELRKPLPLSLPIEAQMEHVLNHAVLKEANEAFARHYGLPRVEQLLGRDLRALHGNEIPSEVLAAIREFLENGGRLAGREIEVHLPNGEKRWLSYTAVGIFAGPELQAIWGTQRDVTARKRAEEDLKRQLHRLTVLHRASQEIVQALAEPERAYEAVHRAVAELMPAEAFVIALRRSEQEAVAVYLFDRGGRFPPQLVPKGQGLTWHILSTGKSLLVRDLSEVEVPAIHFGTPEPVRSLLAVPLKAGEETIGMLSTQSYRPNAFSAEDLALLELLAAHVTAALRNSQLLRELRESEERFRRLAESAPDLIYRYRLKPTPGFDYVNPAAARIVGYTPEEHYADPELGRKIVHPEDRPKLEALRQGAGPFGKPLEFRWLHKDGHIVWTEQINIPVYDEKGELVAIEGIARDITERKRAEEERLAWARALERVFYQVVDAFASAMDLREPYTAGHQRRVAELACAVAEEMGLPGERIRGLRIAALLHDIGKALFVPIEILSKPGKLTELEMALIREHPRAGYEILRRVEFPWPVAEIVHQHHERLDGSGYPRGLRDEEILLEAKILAVADVVEAMSSHRPYRPALGVEAALAEIRQKAGKLYDPAVVEACLRIFAKGFRFPQGSQA